MGWVPRTCGSSVGVLFTVLEGISVCTIVAIVVTFCCDLWKS